MKDFNDARYGELDHLPEETADARMQAVFRLLEPHRGKRLLDVGCMDGFISEKFREQGFYTIGLDGSPRAVERARKTGRCDEAYVANFDELPFPMKDGYVDGVFAGEVLEHVFATESFLEELARVTVPGGFMVLTTPNLAAWINRLVLIVGYQPFFTEVGIRPGDTGNRLRNETLPPAGHIRVMTRTALEKLLERSGWKVVRTEGAGSLLHPLVHRFDKVVSRWFPSLASGFVMYCRRK